MSFSFVARIASGLAAKSAHRNRVTRSLRVESLEDRRVLASLVVGPGDTIDGKTLTGAGAVSLNDAGDIAFLGEFSNGGGSQRGLFTLDKLLAAPGDVIDGETLLGFYGSPSINDAGDVYFVGEIPAGSAVFRVDVASGVGSLIAAEGDIIDGKTLLGLVDVAANDGGDLAISAGYSDGSDQLGIFSLDALLVSEGDTIDGHVQQLIAAPTLNDSGDLAFVGASIEGREFQMGLYTLDSQLAAPGDVIDSQTLTNLHPGVASNDAGDIVFVSGFSEGIGIFTQNQLVFTEGDTIDGITVIGVFSASINDTQEVVFQGAFEQDGLLANGIFRLDLNAFVTPPPTADNVDYRVRVNRLLVVDAADGLLGDQSDGGGQLTTEVDRGPLHGTLTLNEDGSFIYFPDTDFLGKDQFTYQASIGTAKSEVAVVTITVSPAPRRPIRFI